VTGDAAPGAAEAFVHAYGEALAHNLGHHCFAAAGELCASLARDGALPAGVTPDRLMRVLLSLRATLELMAVERRFGEPAHDALLGAMEAYYGRTLLERGRFVTWIAAAHETMRRSENPRDWLRIHAMNLLRTREPEDGVFHTSLAYGMRVGDPIVAVIEANLPR
jgi:hypothetical protein